MWNSSEQRRPPLFLCDVMLARFARYLRAAGYDTALAGNQAMDRDILRQAREEGRYLLTVDQKILEHKAARGRVVLLPHASLDAQAQALGRHFDLDWTSHAFSRCLLDNTRLQAVTDSERERVPLDARRPGEPLLYCPACRRVYWRGSHYRRMMGRLIRWQQDFRCSVAGPGHFFPPWPVQ